MRRAVATALLALLGFPVNDELATLVDDGRRYKDQQISRAIDLGPPPEQGSNERNATQYGYGFDKCGLFTFQHATHGDSLTGPHHDAGRQFLRAGFGESDVEGAGDVALGICIAKSGKGNELDILAHPRIQREQDALAIAADAGQYIQLHSGLKFGGFA